MTEAPPTEIPDFWPCTHGPRLPRIALMGEFSAGKSTLVNLMVGANPLPVQVVATQLPPVWMAYGSQPSVIVDLAGNEVPCRLDELNGMSLDDVAFIKFYCEEEILKRCELIDMPGISDPNMASIIWERMMPFADGVVWCSPATQAWRQSEAAVWEGVEAKVQANSILLLTRADMLLTARDKARVITRVKSEADAAFRDILMMSLTQARDAMDNEELWHESGADDFVLAFLSLVEGLASSLEDARVERSDTVLETPRAASIDGECATGHVSADAIVPRRPKLRRSVKVERPASEASTAQSLAFMPKFS
ncbi:dynamin family protein [Roseobacter sp. OBYS 0001]|uniref:dynamin family protein n=1 Tax=Roseobacter sp. OBYS 0001 TaxID=882651 RepID=UPI001BBB5FA3|nr:dynamin family protein [Roseobacter sp. OBYS 0001]GIT85524.1 hypothetical protein ROBYS_05400 [Roseobacter sp. OBYS 0001]